MKNSMKKVIGNLKLKTLPGKIPIQAVAFFRSLMDEDHSKDTNFFHEDEIITD
jgi:hypothetical protein